MCRNGHTSEPEMMAGRMRCRECYREANRIRAQRRRDRAKEGKPAPTPYNHKCPYCSLFPCRCEEL